MSDKAKPAPTGTTVTERLQTTFKVTCIECGHVGEAFIPIDLNAEMKAWGEQLIRAAYQLGREDERNGVHDGDILEALREPPAPAPPQEKASEESK